MQRGAKVAAPSSGSAAPFRNGGGIGSARPFRNGGGIGSARPFRNSGANGSAAPWVARPCRAPWRPFSERRREWQRGATVTQLGPVGRARTAAIIVRGRVNGPRQGRLNGSRLLIAQDWPLAAGCPTPARGGRVKGAEPFRFRRSRPLTLPSTRAATNDRQEAPSGCPVCDPIGRPVTPSSPRPARPRWCARRTAPARPRWCAPGRQPSSPRQLGPDAARVGQLQLGPVAPTLDRSSSARWRPRWTAPARPRWCTRRTAPARPRCCAPRRRIYSPCPVWTEETGNACRAGGAHAAGAASEFSRPIPTPSGTGLPHRGLCQAGTQSLRVQRVVAARNVALRGSWKRWWGCSGTVRTPEAFPICSFASLVPP